MFVPEAWLWVWTLASMILVSVGFSVFTLLTDKDRKYDRLAMLPTELHSNDQPPNRVSKLLIFFLSVGVAVFFLSLAILFFATTQKYVIPIGIALMFGQGFLSQFWIRKKSCRPMRTMVKAAIGLSLIVLVGVIDIAIQEMIPAWASQLLSSPATLEAAVPFGGFLIFAFAIGKLFLTGMFGIKLELKKTEGSSNKNTESEKVATKKSSYADDQEDKVRKLIVDGYREIASKRRSVPTEKMTDDDIYSVYMRVAPHFRAAADSRGEKLSVGQLSFIAWKFMHVFELIGPEMVDEHLDYEIEKYISSGLRDEYNDELDLIAGE